MTTEYTNFLDNVEKYKLNMTGGDNVGIAPLDQYNALAGNLEDFKTNIRGVVKTAQPLIQSGLISGCELAKIIAEKICWMTGFVDGSVVNNNKLIDNLFDVTKLPIIEGGMTEQDYPYSFFKDKARNGKNILDVMVQNFNIVKNQFMEVANEIVSDFMKPPQITIDGDGYSKALGDPNNLGVSASNLLHTIGQKVQGTLGIKPNDSPLSLLANNPLTNMLDNGSQNDVPKEHVEGQYGHQDSEQ